jgi:hypothetical protein
MSNHKRLKRDGSYGVDINAYSDAGAKRKAQFLRDARALLRQVGQHLARVGMAGCDLRVNPGGIAVSGDVYADFWMPESPEKTIYCTISASACTFLGGRQDGLCIMARTHTRISHNNGRTWHVRHMGANNWVSPEVDSLSLAAYLLRMAGMHPQAEHLENALATPADPCPHPRQGSCLAQISLFKTID